MPEILGFPARGIQNGLPAFPLRCAPTTDRRGMPRLLLGLFHVEHLLSPCACAGTEAVVRLCPPRLLHYLGLGATFAVTAMAERSIPVVQPPPAVSGCRCQASRALPETKGAADRQQACLWLPADHFCSGYLDMWHAASLKST